MNEQLTTKAQEALSIAVRSAATAGNPQVEPIHILRALLAQSEGLTSPLLEAAGADVAAVRRDEDAAADALPSASGSTVGSPGLARPTYAVLSHAGEVARELDDEYVSTEHLLVGLAHVDSPVKDLLGKHGVTAERLRAAVADGRLQLTELDERLSAAYEAKTYAELERITADLPPAPGMSRNRPLTLKTKSGTLKRTGRWDVPADITAEATSGTINLNFTEAYCPHRQVHIQANATSGSVVLIVPPGWGVIMDDATSTSGSIVNKVDVMPAAGATTLIVSGGVRSGMIKARYPRTGFWRRLFGP
jgi:hypothetical protein